MIKAFKDYFIKMSSDEGNAVRFRIIYSFCFVIHSFYAILFACFGITELMIFNTFSSFMYLTGLLAVRNNRFTIVWILLVSVEIMLHSLVCSYFLGYEYQFCLYSLAIIPVTYFMTYLDPEIKHAVVMSSVLAVIQLFVMIACMDWCSVNDSIYTGYPKALINSIARLNLVAASVILVSFSVMFIGKINYDLNVLKSQNDTLDHLANYDQLTGLRNRNHIYEIFEQYIKGTEPYCVVLGDIDDFKRVNDTYGHSAGDAVLKTVSSIIRDNVGDSGEVCRWGGEEILILLKGSTENGKQTAEKILDDIRDTEVLSGKHSIKVTMTFGLCDYSDAMNIEKLISLADKRLYIGKKNGKNKVVAAN